MSTKPSERTEVARAGESTDGADVFELCEYCGSETPHAVAIRILSESDDPEKAAFSRQPYRRSTCLTCGEASMIRLNAA